MSLKVLLDVDGVLADLVGALSEATSAFRPEDVTTYDFSGCLPKSVVRAIGHVMVRPGFVEEMPECHGARRLLVDLIGAGHQPIFVTKPYQSSPTWVYERTRWLERTFGIGLHIVHTASKELIGGDILIEDSPANIETWLKAHPKAWAFLVDRPWNRGAEPGRHTRVESLEEIPRLIGKGWAA